MIRQQHCLPSSLFKVCATAPTPVALQSGLIIISTKICKSNQVPMRYFSTPPSPGFHKAGSSRAHLGWGHDTTMGAQCLNAASLRSHPTPVGEPRLQLLPGHYCPVTPPQDKAAKYKAELRLAHLIVPLKLHHNDNFSLPSLGGCTTVLGAVRAAAVPFSVPSPTAALGGLGGTWQAVCLLHGGSLHWTTGRAGSGCQRPSCKITPAYSRAKGKRSHLCHFVAKPALKNQLH